MTEIVMDRMCGGFIQRLIGCSPPSIGGLKWINSYATKRQTQKRSNVIGNTLNPKRVANSKANKNGMTGYFNLPTL